MNDLDLLLDAIADRVADRVIAMLANGNGHAATEEPDVLLTAAEAAQRLGVKVRWIYGRRSSLPFAVPLPGRALRFSARGIERFIAKRRG